MCHTPVIKRKTLADASNDDVGGVRFREHRPLAAEPVRVLAAWPPAPQSVQDEVTRSQAADAIFIID